MATTSQKKTSRATWPSNVACDARKGFTGSSGKPSAISRPMTMMTVRRFYFGTRISGCGRWQQGNNVGNGREAAQRRAHRMILSPGPEQSLRYRACGVERRGQQRVVGRLDEKKSPGQGL